VDALAQVGRRLHDASVLARVDAQLGEREREIDALQRTAREHELASARRDEHVSQLIEHNRSLLDEVRALRTTLQAARDEVVNLTAARNFLAEELARLKGEDSPAAATAAPAAEATTVPRSDEETH
jgi:chromosome segregation ATPase